MRTCFGAAFPLFANQMYSRMGTVGATAFLAGLMTLMAPLPCVSLMTSLLSMLLMFSGVYRFVFAKIGGRLREKSPYATHCTEPTHEVEKA